VLRVAFRARKGSFPLEPRFEAGDELVVLIGASGSGKSLTLKAVAGLLTPDSGTIVLPGGVIAFDAAARVNIPPQRRSVGYVVQDLALFPHLTVRQNIEFGLMGRPRAAVARRATELIGLLRLDGLEDRRPGAISGGQQQRVALARALAGAPRLLLLDEPFSALDPALRSELRRELLSLRRRLGLTVLFVTHDIGEAYALADRIVVYHDGRVIQDSRRDDVYYRPASIEVARLVGVRNTIPGHVSSVAGEQALVRTPWFTAVVRAAGFAAGGDVFVCIRPEHVIVPREHASARDARDTVLEARVVEDEAHPMVHSLSVHARAGESSATFVLEADVPSHPYELLELRLGASRQVVLPYERLFLIPRT
jgi:molybdate transport system ATP-binding protein